ncbi:MAG: hypothetical protein K2L16_06130 [Muribaculaceae bacterium]|nr:hypothetical protein [Muribaculaceae bacterium]
MAPSLRPDSIRPDDIVMARATYRGRIVASFSSNGFNSLADVIRAVRLAAGSAVGYLNITLRNATRGWTEERALFITPAAPGVQLRLF